MISLVTSFSGLCQFEEIPFPGFGFQFVTKVYLPRKLRQGDWI